MKFGDITKKLTGIVQQQAKNEIVNSLLQVSGNANLRGYGNSLIDYINSSLGLSKNEAQISNLYESDIDDDINTSSDIFGNYGGLTTGSPRTNTAPKFLSSHPSKYGNVSDAQTDKYSNNGDDDDEFRGEYINESGEKFTDDETNQSSEQQGASPYHGMLRNDSFYEDKFETYNNSNQNKIPDDNFSDVFKLKLPDWSYADFINERAIWQKGLSSIFDEPGWFYFKIFFDFNNNHGLFGGLLNSEYLTQTTNSAAKYLYSVRTFHKYLKPKDRINSLYKFVSILSYINTNAPWYFKNVKGLNNAITPILNDFSKEKSIEIDVLPDAIDMRLSTLMSLYYYACFDKFTGKEVIPVNLRQFNMSVILFQTPLRYLHTSYKNNQKFEALGLNVGSIVSESVNIYNSVKSIFKKSSNKKQQLQNPNITKYKTLTAINNDYENVMSMKIFTFYGCEFDKESLANIIPGSITNENPYQLGNSTIKIKYTSCYEHTMNEFYGMMFGSNGFYFNQYNNFQLSVDNKNWNGYFNNQHNNWKKQLQRYETLSNMLGGASLAGVLPVSTYKKAVDATEAIMNGYLEDENGLISNLGVNFGLGLLGSSLNTNAPQGNLYGDVGVNSDYYKDKLEMLKKGVHERTTAPYTYDPKTGQRTYYHESNIYSAYNNSKPIYIDVYNWLNTRTQDLASRLNDKLFDRNPDVNGKNDLRNMFTEQPHNDSQVNIGGTKEENKNKWERTTQPYTPKAENINKQEHTIKKSNELIDDPTTWDRTQEPYIYDPKQQPKENKTTWDRTQEPYVYDSKEAVNYETSKTGGKYKSNELIDDPTTWNRTQEPYIYDPLNIYK